MLRFLTPIFPIAVLFSVFASVVSDLLAGEGDWDGKGEFLAARFLVCVDF